MFITDLYLEQSGSLRNVTLEHLRPGMTVVWGPNGSGKTTVVRFLRGVLHGFHGLGAASPGRDRGTGGSLRIRHHQHLLTLARRIGSSGDQPLTVTSADGEWPTAVRHDDLLPTWVTENVFRDVFTVGYEEAEQFDLLVRLCLECGEGVSSAAGEIRMAEQALFRIVQEREGDSSQRGLTARMGELRQRIDGLRQELSTLRRAPADLAHRIRLQVSEIETIGAQTDRIQVRLGELVSQIEQLECLLSETERRNIVPLDRDALESEIRILTARQAHWRRIHEAIWPECGPGSGGRGMSGEDMPREQEGPWRTALQSQDSLRSVRALVQRIEERVHTLASSFGRGEWALSREGSVQECGQLQTETNALCCYLSQHELAVSRNDEFLEQLFVERCLREASRVEWMLEQRLMVLRAELRRCENVLAEQAIPDTARSCSQPGHRAGGACGVLDSRFRTVQQIEDELAQCVAERTRLQAERMSCDERRQSARLTLERLQQEHSGAATLEQVDELRAHLAEAEARIVLLEDQRRQLAASEDALREVISRLRLLSHSRVLELASTWLARLTQGECTQIVCRTGSVPVLRVQTIHSPEPFTIEQLSRGARHQLALALRLALIRIRAESGEHVPLVLDDVFITSDDARASAAVELLSEIAATGQQILFFTCQRDVRDLFTRFHADLRNIGQRQEEPAPVSVMSPIPTPQLKAYVEDVRMADPAAQPTAEHIVAALAPAEEEIPASAPILSQSEIMSQSDTMLSERQIAETAGGAASSANWLFYLETERGIEDLAGISLSELEALRVGGLRTIGDLLENPVTRIEEWTRAGGFLLSAERLDALRGQAELACRVPMLRCGDAALLYAAGIRTVEELRKLRPEVVFDRVVAFQKSAEGSRFRRSGRLIDRQQAINWARCGQHSRLMAEAATSRSRFFARGTTAAPPRPGDEETGVSRTQRRQGNRPEAAPSVRRRLLSEPLDASQRRARRLARRRQLASGLLAAAAIHADAAGDRSLREHAETAVAATNIGGRHLRFFLSRSSDIAAAPSVGPGNAESLKQLGIRTVDDLLSHSAERLTKQLNHSRITPGVIEQWQAQAKLMCQVPELRCHDVQLLVACGLSDPDDLARRNPAELLSIILPFASCKAGERILRKGRKPDLAEVTNWIKWAGCARALRAA